MMREGSLAPMFPAGTKFGPNDLGLVRLYLQDMVYRKQSHFITTLDVYSDEPWLLDHVHNHLFKSNEWYYFVPRKTKKRTVPGRGESEGGTWKSTSGKEAIKDKNEKVEGYKRCLVYNKKVKGKIVKTSWLMTEYSLHKKDDQDDLVLCWIRGKTMEEVKNGFVKQVPRVENNILSNQAVQENKEARLNALMREFGELLNTGGNITQQQQQQGQVMSNQVQDEEAGSVRNLDFDDVEDDWMFDIGELMNTGGDATQQQPIYQAQDPRRFVGQVMFTST